MIKLTTQQLAQILNANLIGDGQAVVENINTDTRKSVSNSLFFALKGEHFDAHQYLDKAVEQGATALVVQQANTQITTPQLVVADTRLALGQLAKWLREKINPRTVAMTGSSGKTTVKEMTASILQQTAGNPEAVLFTNGNFNNDIGVPLTLLRLTEQHKFAVIELGANHQGEIDYTTHLAQPEAALVNNVAAAHLEGFGSIEGVARAKGEIYRGLTQNGVAIINSEHNYIELCRIEINLPYLGEHNVKNALAATALAMNVSASLADVKVGLEHRSQVKGRLFPIQVNENLLLLDDTYNANVDSLQAAIDVLKGYDAFRILLVGDMKELGEDSLKCHQQVGEHTKQAKLDLVLSYGTESAVISEAVLGKHFTDKAELTAYTLDIIKQKLQKNQKVVVLAKGSRSMKMEETIYSLKDSLC